MKKLQEKAETPALGIYVHVPFCARSCDFCHFYQEAPQRRDLEAYLAGMETSLAAAPPPRPAQTFFWGGGTPGLLPAADMRRLGEALLRANEGVRPQEWTVEMAPSTVKLDRLEVLLEMGVNRFSMGVQSFQPALLEALGRIHSLQQVERALDTFRSAGVDNFNIDLIFAIPGQSLHQWEADLRQALAANPAHLSTYCLTFEEDTALWLRLQKGQVTRRGADEEATFFERAWAILAAEGLFQYEVSNFAKPGRECRHNLDTWRMQEWLGYGPSASSQMGMRRWTQPHSLEQWLSGLDSGRMPFADEGHLTPRMLAQDCLIFGLRMNDGVDLDALQARFPGVLPPSWEMFRQALIEEGLALERGSFLCLTNAGRLLADRIGEEILGLE